MNKLTNDKRCAVVRSLVDGCSIRATVRMTGVAKNTIVKLLADLGQACEDYQDKVMVNLSCRRLQVDEIWSFVRCKQKNIPAEHAGEYGYGDCWTFTCIDADTKLIPCWLVGWRNSTCAQGFIENVAARMANRVQLTTDGHKMYLDAVDAGFKGQVDYSMLVKMYGPGPADAGRYSPAECNGCKKTSIIGHPDKEHVSTSYVERANLTMRMSMRRFTRLTNAFSKKVENLEYSVVIHFFYYNFCRVHMTLRTTPAMAAKVTDHLWTIEDMVGLLDS